MVKASESQENSLWGGGWHSPPLRGQGKHPLGVSQAVFLQCRQVAG